MGIYKTKLEIFTVKKFLSKILWNRSVLDSAIDSFVAYAMKFS